MMKFLPVVLVCFALALFLFGADEKDAPKDWVEYPLTYSADWNAIKEAVTADPKIVDIADSFIPLPNPKDEFNKGFACKASGKVVSLDVDGDGVMERDIKDKENLIAYKLDYGDGQALPYQMRVWQRGTRKTDSGEVVIIWSFQRACFMRGKTPVETFTLIDDNNNGCYNDFGADAIIIGSGKQAELLSSVVMVKGKLYELKPERNGAKIALKEYTGPTGKVETLKGLNFPGQKPEQVIITSENNIYFNVPIQKSLVMVPVGEYWIFSASLGKRAKAKNSRQTAVQVVESKDKPTLLKWGGPFKLSVEPQAVMGGNLVKFIPPADDTPPRLDEGKPLDCPFIRMNLPKIVGVMGEEYAATPDADGNIPELPDPAIKEFKVDITPKKGGGAKPLNKIGNSLVDNWVQIDPSGLMQKATPYWEIYQCPMYNFRGLVVVKVYTKSPVFGDLAFEKEVEVTGK